MKSPFPGMDPFLESHWGDVHTRLMVYSANQLNAQLPDELQARVEEGLAVREQGEIKRTVYPDVQIAEETGTPFAEGATAGTAMVDVAKPYLVQVEDDNQTSRHLEIVDSGARVITVVEILSPGNKIGVIGQSAYLRKQREYLGAGVNLVEIDLIRAGHYVLAVPEDRLPDACRTLYLVCIRRATQPLQAELYPVPLRQPLPNIPIPLRPKDNDVILQLQPLLDDCYRDGRYQRLDYRGGLTPPLERDDAKWVDSLLSVPRRTHRA